MGRSSKILSRIIANLSPTHVPCNVAVAIVFSPRCAWRAVDYASQMNEPEFSAALPLADLDDGATKLVVVAGTPVLLCRDEGTVYAIENRCSHLEETLTCGKVKWGWIACPAHGARFDLATGQAMNPPATASIRTFPVRVIDGMIEVAT